MSFEKDSGSFTWEADIKWITVSAPALIINLVIDQLLLLWKGGSNERDGEREEREESRDKWRSKGWLVRLEERKNFSMMKQSVLLSDWTRLPPMGGPAPWQQALSPREKQPYPSTPPYFSLPFTLTTPLVSQLQGPVYLSLGKHKWNGTQKHTEASWVTWTKQLDSTDTTNMQPNRACRCTSTYRHTDLIRIRVIHTHTQLFQMCRLVDDSHHTLTADSSVPLRPD